MMNTLLRVFSWTCLRPSIASHTILLIAKLDSYGLDRNLLKYTNSYLDNRKQCVRINNIYSAINDIISGVSQSSLVGPILFNSFFDGFFFIIQHATIHNFADDNTLSSFAKIDINSRT